MRNRSGVGLDLASCALEELENEIARVKLTLRLTPSHTGEKRLFARLIHLEKVRAERFDIPAPQRRLRARQT